MARALAPVSVDDDKAAWPRGTPVLLSVPGEWVVCFTIAMPAGVKGRKADRIALHGLSECVAEPLSALHIITAPTQNAAARTVFAVNAARLERTLVPMKQAGVAIEAITPDYLLLPWEPGTIGVAASHDRLVVRTSRYEGFASEGALAFALIDDALAGGTIQKLTLSGDCPNLHALCARHGVAVEQSPQVPAPSEPVINLATGPFRAERAMGAGLRRWMIPGMLVLAGFAAFVTSETLRGNRAAEALKKVDAQIEQAVRADLVPTGPLLDVKRQTERALSDLRSGSVQQRRASFVPLLARADRLLVTGTQSVSSLDYRAGTLRAEITMADFSSLETLSAALADQGLTVVIERSETTGGEGVNALLAVSLTGGGDG